MERLEPCQSLSYALPKVTLSCCLSLRFSSSSSLMRRSLARITKSFPASVLPVGRAIRSRTLCSRSCWRSASIRSRKRDCVCKYALLTPAAFATELKFTIWCSRRRRVMASSTRLRFILPFRALAGTITLSGGQLKKLQKNELKRVDHHRLMWLYQ